jgi:uncharacterized repeat protein (TIGR01451 family)
LNPGLYTLLNTVLLETSNGFTQEAYDETVIPYGPDLSITKESDPPIYTYPGGEVIFTLTIRNKGNVRATDVVVIDDYSQRYLVVDPEEGYVRNGSIIWEVGDLEVDEEKTLTYLAIVVDEIGANTVTIPNEAIVTLNEPDINESDNIALYEIIATCDPVLSISQTSDKTTYEIDEEVEYTIVITNNSTADAYNIELTDVIQAEFDYIAGSTMVEGVKFSDPSGTNELVWSLGYLASGESVTLTFRVIPNENCSESNYLATANVIWQDEQGESFGPASSECMISIVEEEEVIDGIGDIDEGDLVDLVSESLDGLIEAASTRIYSNLAKAGTFVYLKVLLGLVLALPLPLILIFSREESSKGKAKKEIVEEVRKSGKKRSKKRAVERSRKSRKKK